MHEAWTLTKNRWPAMPEEHDFRKSPGFYTILTVTGKVMTAYPRYAKPGDIFSTDRWHAPDVGDIWPTDVIAYKPLEIPEWLVETMRGSPKNRSRTFQEVYGSDERKG